MSNKKKAIVFKMPDGETVSFVPVTAIVPKKWASWFYDAISSNAPFSWGDNNRTLVTAERFANHVEETVFNGSNDDISEEEIKPFLDMLRANSLTYIDLEN